MTYTLVYFTGFEAYGGMCRFVTTLNIEIDYYGDHGRKAARYWMEADRIRGRQWKATIVRVNTAGYFRRKRSSLCVVFFRKARLWNTKVLSNVDTRCSDQGKTGLVSQAMNGKGLADLRGMFKGP